MKTWLPIKSEYLIENFDNLLIYLQNTDYNNIYDGFLTETIEKLESVAKTILENNFSHHPGILDTQDEAWIRNLKIVSTSIYASFKFQRNINDLLLDLLDTLIINGFYNDEHSFEKIKTMLIALANDHKVRNVTYNLRDLMAEDFNVNLFSKKLLSISFHIAPYSKLVYNSRGRCVIESDQIKIMPTWREKSGKEKIKSQYYIAPGVELFSDEKGKWNDSDFKDQVVKLNLMLQSQLQNISQSGPKKLKEYDEDQELFVEVEDINATFGWVKCRTLDPAYQPLELNLYLLASLSINPAYSISRTKFIEHLQKNKKLKVKLFKKDNTLYFSILESLRECYFDVFDFDISRAIFYCQYSMGTRWITDLGRMINIRRNEKDKEIEVAMSSHSGYGIEVRYIETKMDGNGSKIINAERIGEIVEVPDYDEFIDSAIDNLIIDYFEYCEDRCPQYEYRAEEHHYPLSQRIVDVIGHLLINRGELRSLPHQERYLNVVAANSLAIMSGQEYEALYSEYSISYLRALWAFAQDCGHEWLRPEDIPTELKASHLVASKHKVISILSGYKEENRLRLPDLNAGIDSERLQKLVDGSNALLGNISEQEIHRIKRSITQYLGIEDLYKESGSDKFCFGEESDMLEFKKSVVFPPQPKGGNQIANPNLQIWTIIKTINGFLNSLHGGTLFIGVNDYGNAEGIEADIDWLYNNSQLLNNTVDRYIQYIKLRIDNAFEAYKRNERGREITSTRIKISSFPTDGYKVLRIVVTPYETGCVKIVDTLHIPTGLILQRPANIAEAYIRNYATTESLNDRMREKIESDKRKVIKDGEEQKAMTVQEGIDTRSYVKLIGYNSSNKVSDRIIAPIELLPLRGLVVALEKEQSLIKVYKLKRCNHAEITPEKYNLKGKLNYQIDPFNTLISGKMQPIHVSLDLKRPAWLRLREFYPYADNFIQEQQDKLYPFRLICSISDVKGIGSFCMSMLDYIRINEGDELKDYLMRQCKSFL